MLKFPEKFILRYKKFIPDFENFLTALGKPLKPVIRINPLKIKKEELMALLKDLQLEPLPFSDSAFRVVREKDLEENLSQKRSGITKRGLGRRLEHFLGYIYVQEMASMLPPIALDPKPYESILDLTAAPGSKTTQIAAMMDNTGLIVANDVSRKRIKALTFNIDRAGALNVVITNIPGERFGNLYPNFFDRILLDAPCSAEGTIWKNPRLLFLWSEGYIKKMAKIQKALLVSAFKSLKDGGTLVYATCTFAPEENEGVVNHLLKKFPFAYLAPIGLKGIKIAKGITQWEDDLFDKELEKCVRIYPHYNECEGFFIAKIKKGD